MSDGASFSYEMYAQGSSPSSLAAIWIVRMTCDSPFQRDLRVVFSLSDSKSEGWETIRNVSSESWSYEVNKKNSGPAQFTGM